MDKVKVSVIGAGIGRLHLRNLKKCADAEIVAICDIDKGRAQQAATDFDIPHIFTDHKEMFAMDELDAVIVCTPNVFHAPQAIDAFRAGKHVMCEKPLSINAIEGAKIVEEGKKSGKVFMMGFNNRFRAESQYLKKLIEQGELGDIYYAKTGWIRRKCLHWLSGWFSNKSLSGGGPLIDIGVHVLDLTLWLMGNPKPVSVMGSSYAKFGPEIFKGTSQVYDVEDLAAGFVKLDNGASLFLESSWESHVEKEEFYTTLVGTKGGAQLDPLKIYKDINGAPVDIIPETEKTSEGHEMAVRHFLACVKGECKCISTGEQGLHIMQILDAIYESTRTGKSVDIK
jgi:predicted dehydrogenase